MKDFLERLAELEVREPPPEFDRQLHQRLNQTLTAQHVLDFIAGAVPWATVCLLRALVGWFTFTLTGKFDDQRRPGKDG